MTQHNTTYPLFADNLAKKSEETIHLSIKNDKSFGPLYLCIDLDYCYYYTQIWIIDADNLVQIYTNWLSILVLWLKNFCWPSFHYVSYTDSYILTMRNCIFCRKTSSVLRHSNHWILVFLKLLILCYSFTKCNNIFIACALLNKIFFGFIFSSHIHFGLMLTFSNYRLLYWTIGPHKFFT